MDSEEAVIETLPEVPTEVPATTEESSFEELPVLAVRDTVIFPGALLPMTVGRPASVALVQSLGENRLLAVISQLDPREDSPDPGDLYQTGTVCVMHKAMRVPKDNLLLFCEGIARIRTREFTATDPFLRARVERMPDVEPPNTAELEALRQNVVGLFQQIVTASPNLSDDLVASANHITEPGRLADFIAGNMPTLGHAERQQLLEQLDPAARLDEMLRHLTRELELVELRGRIQSEVQGQLSQNQREFYLREQLKAIQKELGEGDDSQPRHRRTAREAGSRGHARGSEDGGDARTRPPGAHVAAVARIRRDAHLSGVDGESAVGRLDRRRRWT